MKKMHEEAHYSGKVCKCYASGQAECGCSKEADWTEKEVYQLQARISVLRKALKLAYKSMTKQDRLECGYEIEKALCSKSRR